MSAKKNYITPAFNNDYDNLSSGRRFSGEMRMPASKGLLVHVRDFIIDYIGRHRHPVNAMLHIIGVPAAFYGIYELFAGSSTRGLALLFVGYLMQYLGHRAQGNEVGEVTLIKKIFKKIARRERSEAQ